MVSLSQKHTWSSMKLLALLFSMLKVVSVVSGPKNVYTRT